MNCYITTLEPCPCGGALAFVNKHESATEQKAIHRCVECGDEWFLLIQLRRLPRFGSRAEYKRELRAKAKANA